VRVLVVNTGSSSVKLSVVGHGGETSGATTLGPPGDEATDRDIVAYVTGAEAIDVVGHRIVHGGAEFHEPVVIDAAVRRGLDAVAALAPVHMPPALRLIDLLTAHVDVPQVACFDTAFHAWLPLAAATYAIPERWRELGVRRYGFHGLSCAWSLRRAAVMLALEPSDLRVCVAHLGAGASVSAIREGHSVDTSMGFTPLEGLVMATRSGSVDPGALMWLQTSRGVGAEGMSDQLEHASGVHALTGTGDMGEVLRRAGSGDAAAALARDVYVHSVAAHIAGVATSLDRLDALVFTGGVGENAGEIRDLTCSRLGVIGVQRPARQPQTGVDSVISGDGAAIAVLVIHAREDLEIAREIRAMPDLPARAPRIDTAH